MQTGYLAADVTPQQLERFARLIYDRIGVLISPQKCTLLSNRLRRRLRHIGLSSYDKYYDLLLKARPNDPEWEGFFQEVTTHETYMFRDPHHWDWLRDKFISELLSRPRSRLTKPTLRVWSAACSTGDEATTVACCLADKMPADWKIEILGTDIGADAVRQARTGVFGDRAVRMVPDVYRKRFFSTSPDGKSFVAGPTLQNLMRFEVHNLLDLLSEPPFDLIIVKNVLIYFDAASKRKSLAQICRMLRSDGALITGPADGVAEHLQGFDSSQGWLHRRQT